MADIDRLHDIIPDIVELRTGANFGPYNEGFTHAVIVTLRDVEALERYRKHPVHRQIAEKVDSMFEQSIGIDFES